MANAKARDLMRVVVVGLGVQGKKRRKIAGADCVATVDPVNREAEFRDLADLPADRYDAALLCVPDEPKVRLLGWLAERGKHALVEKPLVADRDDELAALAELARRRGAHLYTAYNHRFEPHFVRLRELVAGGTLGRIYSCRMFYGNGTARLVRDSAWRDQGAGVLPDLGSHLLDTAEFWFGADPAGDAGWRVIGCHRFENRAPDHVVLANEVCRPRLELEMTLLSWRNHFTCDLLAENGSAHIRSLCKWGPSSFTVRRRVLPSGRPPEETVTLTADDPTWELEYAAFTRACAAGAPTDLSRDLRLNRLLRELSRTALAQARD